MSQKKTNVNSRSELCLSDLSKKSVPEIKEIIDRQSKLLRNKSFLEKLPDKGKRIEEILQKLRVALKTKEAENELTDLLSSLTLRPSKMDIDSIEWRNQVPHSSSIAAVNPSGHISSESENSDDDSPKDEREKGLKVLKILASGTAKEKRIRQKKPEVKLVTVDEIMRLEKEDPEAHTVVENIIKDTCSVLQQRIFHEDLAEKTDKALEKESFKPYKSLKHYHITPEFIKELTGSNNSSDTLPLLRTRSQLPKVITAATPPPSKFGEAKSVSLQESLNLQRHQVEKAHEIELRQAAERLAGKLKIQMDNEPNFSHFTQYQSRKPKEADSDDEKISEVFHDEDEDGTGGVSFPLME